MPRNIKDGELLVTGALPAQNATVNSASIDTGTPQSERLEEVEFFLAVPQLTALVDGETLTATVESSSDDATFSAVEGLGAQVITGITGNGTADSITLFWSLPRNSEQYFRVSIVSSATAGDNSAISFEAGLTF